MPSHHQHLLDIAYRLTRQQSVDGSWSAFQLRPGGSNHWTTAAALTALGSVARRQNKLPGWLRQSQQRGWMRLRQDALNHPLGFNSVTPTDADSTTWLCRALVQHCFNLKKHHQDDLAVYTDWLMKNLSYLDSHIDQTCLGMMTYIESDRILEFVGQPGIQSSWLAVHHCVTVNAIQLGQELQEFLPDICVDVAHRLTSLHFKHEPFWWTDSIVIDLIQQKYQPVDQVIDPSALTLRVPFHQDQTGQGSSYSGFSDVEGGVCEDNGIFTNTLLLLSLANQSFTSVES